MKVILFMSMALNGIIARNDDREDFLSDRNWKEFCRLAKDAGCFVVGRRTYEVVRSLYKDYDFDDVEADRIIVTKNAKFCLPVEGYIVASSPQDAIKKARSRGHKKLMLTGGSTLNSAFMKSNLVDEIILDIEPAVLGRGVRLFAEDDFYKRLKLLGAKRLPEGIIQLHYNVMRKEK